MIPIPTYQVLEFLDYVAKNRSSNSITFRDLDLYAIKYMRSRNNRSILITNFIELSNLLNISTPMQIYAEPLRPNHSEDSDAPKRIVHTLLNILGLGHMNKPNDKVEGIEDLINKLLALQNRDDNRSGATKMSGDWLFRDLNNMSELDNINTISDAEQIFEFVEWIVIHHPKIKIIGSIPSDKLDELINEFCKEYKYVEPHLLQKTIRQWLNRGSQRNLFSRISRILSNKTSTEQKQHNPILRYSTVKFHAIFLFLSVGNFSEFINRYWEDLNYLTSDFLDVFYSENDLSNNVSGYKVAQQFRTLKVEPNELPAMILWEDSLNKAARIPLKELSFDQIFHLVQEIVQQIKDGKDLYAIVNIVKENYPSNSNQTTIILGDNIMGNKNTKYDIKDNKGEIGAIGDNSQSSNNVFNQTQNSIKTNDLTEGLELLLAEMKKEATKSEHFESIAKVMNAIEESKKDDKNQVNSKLKQAGQWALDVATKVGIGVAIAALKEALHI